MKPFNYRSLADFKTNNFEDYILDVNPALAEKILSLSIGNRKLNKNNVTALANDMTAGKYDYTTPGSGIAFNTKGQLVNGHHTLNAIIQSGTTQNMVVRTGVMTLDRIDTGKSRTLTDSIEMSEDKDLAPYAKLIANILRIKKGLKLSNSGTNRKDISIEEIRSFGRKNKGKLQKIYNQDKERKSIGRYEYCKTPKKETSIIGSIIFELVYLNGYDFERVSNFMYGIISNNTFGVDCVDNFRKKVLNDSQAPKRDKWGFPEFREKVIREYDKYEVFCRRMEKKMAMSKR